MYYLDKSVIFPCLSCCLGQEITGCFFHLLVGGVGAKKQGFRVRLAPGQDPVLGHISVQCWFVMGLLVCDGFACFSEGDIASPCWFTVGSFHSSLTVLFLL